MGQMAKSDPYLTEAYSTYLLCRTQQLFSVKVSKGKDMEIRIVHFTTGLGQLPWEGGVEDQPYRLMLFFEDFLAGDRIAAMNLLNGVKN